MIKKICLVLLPDESAIFGAMGIRMPPFALGIITSYLRQNGFEVHPFDLHRRLGELYPHQDTTTLEQLYNKTQIFAYAAGNQNDFFDTYAEALLAGIDITQYDIVAYSIGPSMSWVQTHSGLILGQYVKKHYKKIQVFGGLNINNIVSFSPVYDDILRLFLDHFQYVVHGAGEEALLQIINSLNQGKEYDEIKKIDGVVSVAGDGKLNINKQQKRKIICPDFDGLDLDYYGNYIKKGYHEENLVALYSHPMIFTSKLQNPPAKDSDRYEKKTVIPYVFNYGCPYNCAFCIESNPEIPAPTIGKVETVIDHLETLTQKYRSPYFYFINNAVNCSKKYIHDLCDGIIARRLKIYWSDCARFDNIDIDILEKMKQAGCQKLVFGLEVASLDMIKRINKKLDLDFTRRVLQWCNQTGIWAELEIIVGLPTETPENFAESFQYLIENLKYINFLTINKYIPLPKSLMFRNPAQFGIEIAQTSSYIEILDKDLELIKMKKNTNTHVNMMKIFQYWDINGRTQEQVQLDTEKRYAQVEKLHAGHLTFKIKHYIQKGYLSIKDILFLQEKK